MNLYKQNSAELDFGRLFIRGDSIYLKGQIPDRCLRFATLSYNDEVRINDMSNDAPGEVLCAQGDFTEQYAALEAHIKEENRKVKEARKQKEMFVGAMKELDPAQKEQVLAMLYPEDKRKELLFGAFNVMFAAVVDKLSISQREQVLDLVMPKKVPSEDAMTTQSSSITFACGL